MAYYECAFLSAALQLVSRQSPHQSRVNTSHQEWCVMTTLQMAIPMAVEVVETREAQEARWIAWKSKGAATDRIMQRRIRIAFMAILIALACVTLASIL